MLLLKPSRLILLLLTCQAFSACDNDNPNTEFPAADKEQTELTPEELAKTNAAFRLNQQGDSALHSGDFQGAMILYQMSLDSAAADADSFAYYDTRLDLACLHDRLNELNTAIEIAEPVLAAYIRSEDSVRIGRAYSTLAAFYGRAKMTEKMLVAAQNGFQILRTRGSLIERCAAYNQLAFTFSDAGHWEQALPLLDSALLLMQSSGVLDQLPAMYLNIGNCHRKLGHWPAAQRYFKQAENHADSLGQVYARAVALERLSQVATATGNHADALSLYRESVVLKDTLFTREKARNIQALEIGYQTKEKEIEIQLLRANQMAEVARRNLMLLIFSISITLTGILLHYWRKKFRHAQLALAGHQQQLHEFAHVLLDKNTRLGELEMALNAIKANAAETIEPDTDETTPSAQDSQSDDFDQYLYNRRILTDTDWEVFKSYFERGHPGYLQRLRTSFPKLSGAEERLLLLLKLNFNSNEASSTLGISKDSVKKGRQRLRKRLGLKANEDLEQFIQSF